MNDEASGRDDSPSIKQPLGGIVFCMWHVSAGVINFGNLLKNENLVYKCYLQNGKKETNALARVRAGELADLLNPIPSTDGISTWAPPACITFIQTVFCAIWPRREGFCANRVGSSSESKIYTSTRLSPPPPPLKSFQAVISRPTLWPFHNVPFHYSVRAGRYRTTLAKSLWPVWRQNHTQTHKLYAQTEDGKGGRTEISSFGPIKCAKASTVWPPDGSDLPPPLAETE
ncbi:unnamed protein product [Protopolystoma xenopodis]|uniref:Uncharacterized protein n=1 Tax=Protopolystoma xenopodis TaxID=117903 RepID=A0A448XJ12_9PLAT|nr:unnamed protein product [Protopolystoma xenopodis]